MWTATMELKCRAASQNLPKELNYETVLPTEGAEPGAGEEHGGLGACR